MKFLKSASLYGNNTDNLIDGQQGSSRVFTFGPQGWLGINIGTQGPQASLDVGGGVAFRRTTTATNYTILKSDTIVGVTSTAAPRTITLPAANTFANGQFVTVVDESGGAATNNITIVRAGSDTILGGTSFSITGNYGAVTLYSNGSNAWFPQVGGVSQGSQGVQGASGQNGSYRTTFTSASLSSGILTVTHNLNSNIVAVSVYNNNSQVVIPNQITITSNNACTVDLNGNGVTGTWSVVVLAGGGSGGIGSTLGGGAPNQVLYTNASTVVSQSSGLQFDDTTNKLSVGGSAQLGALTLIDNQPSGNAASLALYNSGGGVGASVSMDLYSTSVNGGIPLSRIRAVDDGNFSTDVEFYTKTPGNASNALAKRGEISSTGSWILNNGALATNATDGFTYLPSTTGLPTGTPTTQTGVPIVYNTGNSTLYAYNSGWKTLGQQGPQGFIGNQGVNGSNGTQGNQGVAGANGTQGNQGVAGVNGTQGNQGVNGSNGTQGNQGVAGANGTQGVQGFNGSLGTQGNQGVAGANGTQGVQGFNGSLGTQGYQGDMGYQGLAQDTISFVLGSGAPVTAGVDKTNRVVAVSNGAISKAYINAKIGPVGADLIIDIKKNGTSIWASTPANRLKITAGGTSGSQTNFDTTSVTAGDLFTIDVAQVGSTTAGQDITVQLLLGVATTPPVQGNQGYQGFQGSSGSALSMGSSVSGGTNKSVLFLGASGVLSQDNTNLNYDSSTQTLTATNITGKGFPRDYTFLLDVGGNATVGTDKSPWIIVSRAATASKVYMSAKTPPAGSGIIVDILYSTNGTSFTSLWSITPANRPSISSGAYIASTTTFDNTSLPAGALLRIDVIQVGSTTPGAGVVVQLHTLMQNF